MLDVIESLQRPGRLERMPRCYLCGSDGIIKRIYNSSDKYQKLIGVMDDTRIWYICPSCHLIWQTNCLTESSLKDIYSHYRDTNFRNESIEQIFNRVNNLNPQESENHYRYHWFSNHIGGTPREILDIGSGFGIWPNMLSKKGWKVTCIEPNEESCLFIRNYLKLICLNSYGLDGIDNQFDVVSLIHVLEHIRKPLAFLKAIKSSLVYNGRLFVEVPDATEFNKLELNNDEFNSTHLFFYDVASLYNLLSREFFVTDIHRVHYEARGLHRIFALCRNIG
jgi:SAM-dependent methyltransferase